MKKRKQQVDSQFECKPNNFSTYLSGEEYHAIIASRMTEQDFSIRNQFGTYVRISGSPQLYRVMKVYQGMVVLSIVSGEGNPIMVTPGEITEPFAVNENETKWGFVRYG